MRRLLLTVLLPICVCPAFAGEVYRWVDEKGVIHYSDTMPQEGSADVETLVVTDRNPPGYDPATDPNNIMNQAARTNEKFAKIEKDREERAEKRQQEINIYLSEPNRRPLFLFGNRNPVFLPPFYPPQRPLPPSYRQQYNALAENDLLGPRPASINSGEHAARVKRSQALPLSLGQEPRPQPRPVPIRTGG